MLKIIFMGTPDFSVPILEGLIDQYRVIGVVTQPDRRVGRKQEVVTPPVKEVAIKHNIPIFQPNHIKEDDEELIALQPDLIVTAAYGQMVSTKLLESPKYGSINVHGSLLPKYRGGAPIQYAIKNGDKVTGITIMYMAKKMDAGDILAQKSIPIETDDTAGTLFEKLSIVGRDLLMETIPLLIDGKIKPKKQDENLVTFAYTIKSEEEQLDLTLPAKEVYNHIRALLPEPAGFIRLGNDKIKIFQAKVSQQSHTNKIGEIIYINKMYFTIGCGKGTALDIYELQVAGKRRMKAQDFINGSIKKYIK